MNIAEYARLLNVEVEHNFEFDSLSLLATETENKLSFIDDEKYINLVAAKGSVSGLFLPPELVSIVSDLYPQISLVTCQSPRVTFFTLLNIINQERIGELFSHANKIHSSAIIESEIPPNASVTIGENTVIGKHVVISPGVTIGSNCIISSFVAIGGEGFEYKRNGDEVLKVSHAGTVEIGNSVDIKEFTSIHRAVFLGEKTVVGDWTKLDGHCHIGHANKLGRACFICSHANISGNSVISDYAYIGPGVNVPNRVVVGENAKVLIGSSLSRSVNENEVVSGNFAIPHHLHLSKLKGLSN